MSKSIFEQIKEGETDLVFDYIAAGHDLAATDSFGVSLLQWCGHHGDVSAIKFLLGQAFGRAMMVARIFASRAHHDIHWATVRAPASSSIPRSPPVKSVSRPHQ